MAPLRAVLAALDIRKGPILFTAPNSDPGSAALLQEIQKFVASHPETRFEDTLGSKLYANALRHADVVIGNSSSGIIEAGLFGLPVINVGDRQLGRESGSNVAHVPSDKNAVVDALDRIMPGYRFPEKSPYGDGQSAPRIAKLLATLPPRADLLRKAAPVAK
jgi:UDP-N-acetylglucosamine 2-epimerase